jgi:hypothetical protein
MRRLLPCIALIVALMTGVVTAAIAVLYLATDVFEPLTCPECVWWDRAGPIVQGFWDTAQVADTTPRIALGPALLDLQNQRRKFQQVSTPKKAKQARDKIDFAMGAMIQVYLSFSAGEDHERNEELMNQAASAWQDAATEFYELHVASQLVTFDQEPS